MNRALSGILGDLVFRFRYRDASIIVGDGREFQLDAYFAVQASGFHNALRLALLLTAFSGKLGESSTSIFE